MFRLIMFEVLNVFAVFPPLDTLSLQTLQMQYFLSSANILKQSQIGALMRDIFNGSSK